MSPIHRDWRIAQVPDIRSVRIECSSPRTVRSYYRTSLLAVHLFAPETEIAGFERPKTVALRGAVRRFLSSRTSRRASRTPEVEAGRLLAQAPIWSMQGATSSRARGPVGDRVSHTEAEYPAPGVARRVTRGACGRDEAVGPGPNDFEAIDLEGYREIMSDDEVPRRRGRASDLHRGNQSRIQWQSFGSRSRSWIRTDRAFHGRCGSCRVLDLAPPRSASASC